MTYPEVIQEIESRTIMPEKAPHLNRMKAGLRAFSPELHFNPARTVLVAGTNGKGSVCASLEALLLKAGETVGLYTSPHLEETTERIRVNGQDIPQDIFCDTYQHISRGGPVIQALSHFEILTVMAAWIFFSGRYFPPVERAIFEVGLGGIWDATNAIPHDVSVITTLSYDHQNILGSTLEDIARNKFGIIGTGGRVIHAPLAREIKALAEKTRQSTGSLWREAEPFEVEVEGDFEPQFILKNKWGRFPTNLPGLRGCENSQLALTVFHELGFDPSQYQDALKTVRWPGRMEKVTEGGGARCPVYLSGDHNIQGVASLVDLLRYYPYQTLYVLVGVGRDKDLEGILSRLFELPRVVIHLTETPFKPRLLKDYGEWLRRASGAWTSPLDGFQSLAGVAQPNDMILVTGSLYLVGAIRGHLNHCTNKSIKYI